MDFFNVSNSTLVSYFLMTYGEARLVGGEDYEHMLDQLAGMLKLVSAARLAVIRKGIEEDEMFFPGCFEPLLDLIDGHIVYRELCAEYEVL